MVPIVTIAFLHRKLVTSSLACVPLIEFSILVSGSNNGGDSGSNSGSNIIHRYLFLELIINTLYLRICWCQVNRRFCVYQSAESGQKWQLDVSFDSTKLQPGLCESRPVFR